MAMKKIPSVRHHKSRSRYDSYLSASCGRGFILRGKCRSNISMLPTWCDATRRIPRHQASHRKTSLTIIRYIVGRIFIFARGSHKRVAYTVLLCHARIISFFLTIRYHCYEMIARITTSPWRNRGNLCILYILAKIIFPFPSELLQAIILSNRTNDSPILLTA